MKFYQVILCGSRVMLNFAKWFHVLHERSYANRAIIEALSRLTLEPCNSAKPEICSYARKHFRSP